MFDANKLRGKMAERGMTQSDVAKSIGISESSMYRKMKTGKFGIIDAERMIDVLHIENPTEIFFAGKVT